MNNKILWGVIIILVAGGGWYYYSQKSGDSMMSGDHMTTSGTSTTTGQAQESGATAQGQSMVGVWKSTEDAKFTRTFNADGTVTDAYAGNASATETASYTTIDPTTEANFPIPVASVAGMTVIRIDFSSGPMYFGILTLTDTNLEMSNLSGRGNTLSFTKVQ